MTPMMYALQRTKMLKGSLDTVTTRPLELLEFRATKKPSEEHRDD